MSLLKLKLRIPPSPSEYYEEALDYAGEVGLTYQDEIREAINKLDPQVPFLSLTGRYNLKLKVIVYPNDSKPIQLADILHVLVDALTFAEVWHHGSIPVDQHIRLGGDIGGYVELTITNSKIMPIDYIDGCEFEWHK